MSSIALQPPQVPFVDPNTGLITREWYRYITDVYTRIGGANPPPDLTALTALLTALTIRVDGDEQAPVAQQLPIDDGDMSPSSQQPIIDDGNVSPYAQQIETMTEEIQMLTTGIRSISEQLSAVQAEIQELKQGTML